jgi:phage repressor protein C with HTH and peptisase S24 domain
MIPRQKMKQSMRAIKVRGPSMEPTILDGAIVGIDTDDRDIMSGLIYLVWKNYEGAVIRRVYVRSGKIILKPDNPVYPEDEIPPENNDENIIIGKVKWIFQSMP